MGKIKEIVMDANVAALIEDAVTESATYGVEAMVQRNMDIDPPDWEDFLESDAGRKALANMRDAVGFFASEARRYRDFAPGTQVLRAEYRDGAE